MNWLRFYMKKTPINQNQLAKAAGTSRQQIGKLLKPDRDIGREWAERLSPFVKATPNELLFGPGLSGDSVTDQTFAMVVAEAAAGLWRERESWDTEKYPPVPSTPGVSLGIPQKAYRIEGNSMDKLRIFDGDFVLTVPYFEVRTSIQHHDVVIVERTRGELVEISCKQVVRTANGVELWPRSTDARYQDPLKIPSNRGAAQGDGESIEVVALVVGRFGYVGSP